MQKRYMTLSLVIVGVVNLFGAGQIRAEEMPSATTLYTVLQETAVQDIYEAGYDVIFGQLKLAKKKNEDCNCSTNKADMLTGRLEALSADNITFILRIHYLEEGACGLWIRASQDSDVPADLKMYCGLIQDRIIRQLNDKKKQTGSTAGSEHKEMDFDAEYNLSIEQLYGIVSDTANQIRIGHNVATRNRFTLIGNFISGNTQFSYKAYMVADDKLKFRFWLSSSGAPEDSERYMFETIHEAFQKQLNAVR